MDHKIWFPSCKENYMASRRKDGAAELRAFGWLAMAGATGLEPVTLSFGD